MKSSHHFLLILSSGILLISFLTVTFLSVILAVANSDRIVCGVTFEGRPLKGMSEDEVQAFFTKTARERLTKNALLLHYGQKTWQIPPAEIQLTTDSQSAAQEAYAVGRSGRLPTNLLDQLKAALFGYPIHLKAAYDTAALEQKLTNIAAAVNQQPVNAACSVRADGSIQHTPAAIGKTLDTDALHEELQPKLLALEIPVRKDLVPKEQAPFIQDSDLASIDSILAVYSTQFGSNANRSENIRIAASGLSGVLVKAGQEFSFNDTVGSRKASAGYKNAAVIIEGKVEQDIGGGVCQVSSTLYNAILLAGLQPTVRTSHFYPSSYVPAGRDATVADGQIDFRFRASLPHNIYLLSSTYNGTLTIYVLGSKADLEGDSITLETNTDKPGPGPTVSVYRLYRRDGQLIEREFLHTDQYDVQT